MVKHKIALVANSEADGGSYFGAIWKGSEVEASMARGFPECSEAMGLQLYFVIPGVAITPGQAGNTGSVTARCSRAVRYAPVTTTTGFSE